MVFRLDLGQICFNLVENVFATRQLALIAKTIAIYDILVPKAYDPSGSNHFEITKEITEFCPSGLTKSSSMAHARNGCSQSSRFLPQVRRIVGSGDENGFTSRFTTFWLGRAQKSNFWFWTKKWPTPLGFSIFEILFSPFSFLFAAVIDLPLFLLAVKKLPRKRHRDGQVLNYHGAARCSGRKFCTEYFTQLFEHFCAYPRFHSPDHSDLGINGKIFSSCRSWV